jgi:hypothetical protein
VKKPPDVAEDAAYRFSRTVRGVFVLLRQSNHSVHHFRSVAEPPVLITPMERPFQKGNSRVGSSVDSWHGHVRALGQTK